jgi:hypothetical protein
MTDTCLPQAWEEQERGEGLDSALGLLGLDRIYFALYFPYDNEQQLDDIKPV